MIDRNCLTYWFPRLLAAGIPVPRTEIVKTELELMHILDDPEDHPWPRGFAQEYTYFLNHLKAAADVIGFPCFLRTGQTSCKHNWKQTCYVTRIEQINDSVPLMIDLSGCNDLATNVWVLREYLPVKPIAVLPRYGGMPLVREMRCFVEGGKILCQHPYWPRGAIRDGLPKKLSHGWDEDNVDDGRELEADDLYLASQMDINTKVEVLKLAEEVAEVFADDGYWSVDVLETERGMFVTDMAVGERSFHWPECPAKKT